MSAFTPPLSLRLNGGLRGEPFTVPLAPLETVLEVRPELAYDLELGGPHYRYAPHPLPERGLVGVLVHANAIPDFGRTYPHRPDLDLVVVIDWLGDNLLDLGRLEWRLRAAFGEPFDVAEYSVATLPRPGDPSHSSEVHWVQFAAAAGRRAVPLPDTPNLACTLEFELPEQDEFAARTAIIGLSDTSATSPRVNAVPAGDARIRLTVSFESPSLLELGRYADAVDMALGRGGTVRGYSVYGDLQRDGTPLSLHHSVASHAVPGWRISAPG
jgi:hypothetical protein